MQVTLILFVVVDALQPLDPTFRERTSLMAMLTKPSTVVLRADEYQALLKARRLASPSSRMHGERHVLSRAEYQELLWSLHAGEKVGVHG
jgi:hypothetical protein